MLERHLFYADTSCYLAETTVNVVGTIETKLLMNNVIKCVQSNRYNLLTDKEWMIFNFQNHVINQIVQLNIFYILAQVFLTSQDKYIMEMHKIEPIDCFNIYSYTRVC